MTGHDPTTKRLFVGICNSQDWLMSSFFWSWVGIKHPYNFSIFRSTHPWDIVRNNVLIENFLRSPCDIFVKMDVDQVYPQDYFTHFVPLVEEYKVIGPLIFDRWRHNDFMPLAFENTGGDKLEGVSVEGGIKPIQYPHTNLFYAREVLEKTQPPWYEAVATPSGTGRANHVDYSFLNKIHEAGYPIYIDTNTVVQHLTTQAVDRELHERWNRGS
jgi:hypothetical protein